MIASRKIMADVQKAENQVWLLSFRGFLVVPLSADNGLNRAVFQVAGFHAGISRYRPILM